MRFVGIVLDITERKQAEERARAREQDLRRFAEVAPVAIAMFDREMRYLAASQRFRDEFSLGDQELVGRSHYDVFPEIPEHWRQVHRRCLAGAVERHPGELFLRPDGTAQWTRWDIQPWHRADGQIGGIVLFTEDITGQKKSEEALRASEANYRTLFESASDGITVTDAQLRYVDANPAACRMFGYTREELLARRIPDVLHAEEIPRLAPFMKSMIAGEVSKSEWRFRRKDGTPVPLRSLCDCTARWAAAEYWARHHRAYAGGWRNWQEPGTAGISDPGDATRDLRLFSEDRHADLVRPDAPPLRIAVPAPRSLMTFSCAGFILTTATASTRPCRVSCCRAATGSMPPSIAPWESKTMSNALSPRGAGSYSNAEGQPVRFVGVTLDISERKRLEDQYRQAQKLESVGRLAGGVAHDFNNLLTVINGYSDMVLGDLPAGGPLHDSVTEIRIAGERAAALSRQLLVLSRKQVIQPKDVNLNDIIVEVERMLGRVIGEDIRLECVLSPCLGSVLADSGQLHQVLMNLAINARDAMPTGGTLRIETRNIDLDDRFAGQHAYMKPGGYVQLQVCDTGSGMTKDVMAHVFEPFFTTKKAGVGTGLGLATVYGIVKQSGGSILVDSEPGKGATFTIFLPRIDAGIKVGCEPAPSPLGGTETILVVEDQQQLRKMVARVLRGFGYRVLEAADPGEALLQSEGYAGAIHLLLTDVVMPGMAGPELAGRMKPSRPAMEVVFMSGYSEGSRLDQQVLQSSGGYLAKPFSPEELALKVREALGPKSMG